MFSMFTYTFMQRALVTGLVMALALPVIGLLISLRRQSMIGDALSHNALAGVALGMILGLNPLWGAMAICVFSAFAMNFFRRFIPRYSEMAIAIVMSTGIGLASILSDFVPTANFNSYLFGSIIAISRAEMIFSMSVAGIVLVLFAIFFRHFFLLAYAPRQARLLGVPVALVDSLFTLMTAITVSVASRTVGALIVSAFMVVPVASAMRLAKSYKSCLGLAVLFSELTVFCGLVMAYQLRLKPGGTFVLLSVGIFILIVLLQSIASRFTKRSLT